MVASGPFAVPARGANCWLAAFTKVAVPMMAVLPIVISPGRKGVYLPHCTLYLVTQPLVLSTVIEAFVTK